VGRAWYLFLNRSRSEVVLSELAGVAVAGAIGLLVSVRALAVSVLTPEALLLQTELLARLMLAVPVAAEALGAVRAAVALKGRALLGLLALVLAGR